MPMFLVNFMMPFLQIAFSADNRRVGNDEMHGTAARVAESDSGEERMNRGIGNDEIGRARI
jgi:hypothetical protein